MLSTFLLVLKIIGIVLLSVIGLVLLIVILVLAVPFRYRLSGSYHGHPDAGFSLTWLLHFISARVTFDGKKLGAVVRILGIPAFRRDDLLGKKEEPEEEQDASDDGEASDEDAAENEKSSENGAIGEAPEEDTAEGKDKKSESENSVSESEDSSDAKSETTAEEKKESGEKDRDPLGFIDDLNDSWQKKKEQLAGKFDEIEKKIHDIRKTIRLIMNEKTRDALGFSLKKLMWALKGWLPRKGAGTFVIGMENPADTGQILGILAMTIPIQKNQITVQPDFENKIFDGEGWIKGHIVLNRIVLAAIRIILHKNVRITIKRFKKAFR